LFSSIGFGVDEGQRIALVAANGAGKSTLLRILSGKEEADKGKVTFRNDIRTAFLEQEPEFDLSDTVYNALFHTGNELVLSVRDYEVAMEKYEAEPSEANQKLLEDAVGKVDALNAWNYEVNVKQILSRLKVHHLDQKLSSLSGGELKRVALARVLIEEPQLLIMDEPTNHLDMDMIEWLENYFVRNNVSLLVVTHDRYFLDNVCTDILELENGKLYPYKGNYEYFIEKKAERELNEAQEFDKAKNLFKKELEWVRKMPRARGTKSKARVEDFHELKDKISSRKKTEDLQLEIQMKRIGKKVLELDKVSKSYGDKTILKDFSYLFKKGERIGIAGKNGVGKTTLLNIILGNEAPDSGKVTVGDTIVFGYYSQKGLQFKEDQRVIEVVKDIAEFIPMGDGSLISASQFLRMFRFPPEMQFNPVSKLSGGEKKRLYLLTVLVKNPNFLILDEPTNDLDLITLSTLEQFLSEYTGCLIIVSHDRYFMDKLADTLFVLEGNGSIKNFNGKYTEYRESVKEQELEDLRQSRKERADEKAALHNTKKNERVLSGKEKQEYNKLEKEMAALEKKKAALTSQLEAGITDHEELFRVTTEIAGLSELIESKLFRWMELGEKAS
jgi:ATP-binding cassette subfamily F protein uup